MTSREFRGTNGYIVVEGDVLVLTHNRTRFVRYETGVRRRIPIQAVSDVRLKRADPLNAGWITLGVGGAAAPDLTSWDFVTHPETVSFHLLAQKKFLHLFDYLEGEIRANLAAGLDPRSYVYDAAVMKSGSAGPRAATPPLEVLFPGVTLIGPRPSDKATAVIADQMAGGDTPWLILATSTSDGILAAWDDRLALIWTSAIGASFATGSLRGSNSATFHFVDITGIEYSTRLLGGVLEIMTPSYQVTNVATGNGLALTKSQYEQALPQIQELRRRISEAKRRVGQVGATSLPVGNTLGDQLARLAQLHLSGVISDDEFTSAKAKLLG